MRRLLMAVSVCLSATAAMAQPPRDDHADWGVFEEPVVRSGTALLLAGYASAVVFGTQTDADDDALYVPLFGPWLELFGLPSCANDEPFCDHPGENVAFYVGDGLVQGAGLVLLVASLVNRDDEGDVVIAPARTGGPGLAVSGRF